MTASTDLAASGLGAEATLASAVARGDADRSLSPTEGLLQRARALVPTLRSRGAATEQLNRLPDTTVEDLKDIGMTAVAAPERFGGLPLDLDAGLLASVEIARGDASSGWVAGLWATHSWLMHMWPHEAQEEYWSSGPAGRVVASTSFNGANASSEVVPGGIKLTGTWTLSSGVDHASWLIVGGPGAEGPSLALVPRSDITIDQQSWKVAGLSGTGSKTIKADGVFVPTHRVLPFSIMSSDTTAGRAMIDSAFLRMPVMAATAFCTACPTLGMAMGAVELFEEQMTTAVSTHQASSARDRADVQRRLGESSAMVDSAYLLLRHDLEEIRSLGRSGEEVTMRHRARWRRDQAHIAKISAEATSLVWQAAGAQVLSLQSGLQRMFRDVNVATHHVTLYWDPVFEVYGRVRFGLEAGTPFI